MSFLSFEAKKRLGKSNNLVKLNQLLNWTQLGAKLKNLHAYDTNKKGGQKPYNSLKMFKAILLGQWYSLSDPELEDALKVRLDFMMFTELESNVPDETTLCRFRNLLVKKGLDKVLFDEINHQLEDLGLKVKTCDGAVIDATIIESASRPRKSIDVIPEDRQENKESGIEGLKIIYSKDPDARWLKKRGKSHFGYKGFVTTDVSDGYIEKAYVTPANLSEMKELKNMIPNRKPKRLYGDKGYASKENRDTLKAQGIKDGIMHKAVRNRPLTRREKLKNKLISSKRFIVEQCFGTLKRRFKYSQSRYISLSKVEGELIFKSMCFNLLKGLNKVELT